MTIREQTGLPCDAMGVRTTVFVQEQGFVDEFDDIDATAVHFVAYDGEKPIGTCRIFKRDGDRTAYVLGRLCVLKAYRSCGVGRALMTAAEESAYRLGGKTLWLHAQQRARTFYLHLGYTEHGEVEDEQGYPHIWMKKVLK